MLYVSLVLSPRGYNLDMFVVLAIPGFGATLCGFWQVSGTHSGAVGVAFWNDLFQPPYVLLRI